MQIVGNFGASLLWFFSSSLGASFLKDQTSGLVCFGFFVFFLGLVCFGFFVFFVGLVCFG